MENPLTPAETKNVMDEAKVHEWIGGPYYEGVAEGMKDIAEEYGKNPSLFAKQRNFDVRIYSHGYGGPRKDHLVVAQTPMDAALNLGLHPVSKLYIAGDGIWRGEAIEGIFWIYEFDAISKTPESPGGINYPWPYENNPSEYEHERLASPKTLAKRGLTKYRSKVTPSGHVLRIAFPPGRRQRGAGEVQAILHPNKNPNWIPIDNNHYIISGKLAYKLASGKVPRAGHEKLVTYEGNNYFLKHERYRNKLHWMLHGPTSWKHTESGGMVLGNPLARIVGKIYSRCEEIRASKAGMAHHCDARCKAAGHRYRHPYKQKACVYALSDGSILIK